jgi:hypothetical protein
MELVDKFLMGGTEPSCRPSYGGVLLWVRVDNPGLKIDIARCPASGAGYGSLASAAHHASRGANGRPPGLTSSLFIHTPAQAIPWWISSGRFGAQVVQGAARQCPAAPLRC